MSTKDGQSIPTLDGNNIFYYCIVLLLLQHIIIIKGPWVGLGLSWLVGLGLGKGPVQLNVVELNRALTTIEQEGEQLGLYLNVHKCELVGHGLSDMASLLDAFPDLMVVDSASANLLGSPLGNMSALNVCLESKIHQLRLISNRLCYLDSHDALILLKHALALPKLLHILRSSPAFASPLLQEYDNILVAMVSQITNNHLCIEDPAWVQASLPVAYGGLGIRSAVHLAPSAFLASADAASEIVRQLLPVNMVLNVYPERESALILWKENVSIDEEPPAPPSSYKQRAWDRPRVLARHNALMSNAQDLGTKARLLATSTKESGAWLSALPCSALGLRMSNDTVRIAVGLRLGMPLCQPHSCIHCNSEVTTLGTHGLHCRRSQGRHPRHFELNQIIHRSLQSAKVPSRLEPTGLSASDRSRPDGLSLIPWSSGKFLVWDATCTDTYCISNINRTSTEAGAAAAHAEAEKRRIYDYLCRSYCFIPVGVETSGACGPQALSLFREVGNRIRRVTGDPLAFTYLMQRISVAIQRGNAMSIMGSMTLDYTPP